MITESDILEAGKELTRGSVEDIERETAKKWGARAIAAYRLAKKDPDNHFWWLSRADDYRHEALEHASLVGDFGKTVQAVQSRIDGEMV